MTCSVLGEKERMPLMLSFSMLVIVGECLSADRATPPQNVRRAWAASRWRGLARGLLRKDRDAPWPLVGAWVALGADPAMARALPPPTAETAKVQGRSCSSPFFRNMAAINAALLCGHCGSHLKESTVLPCSHRFCTACVRSIPGRLCPTCRIPYFENELVSDPYAESILDLFSVLVDQLRNAKRLRTPGQPAPVAPPEVPQVLTAEAKAAAEERRALQERMQVLEKRLRAHQAIVVANACGVMAGTLDPFQPAPAAPELLRTPTRSQSSATTPAEDEAVTAGAASSSAACEQQQEQQQQEQQSWRQSQLAHEQASPRPPLSAAEAERERLHADGGEGVGGHSERQSHSPLGKRLREVEEVFSRDQQQQEQQQPQVQVQERQQHLPIASSSSSSSGAQLPPPPGSASVAGTADAGGGAGTTVTAAAHAASSSTAHAVAERFGDTGDAEDDEDDDRPPPPRSKCERFSFCTTALEPDELAEIKQLTGRSKTLLCTWNKDWRSNTSHVITANKPGSNAAPGARLCCETRSAPPPNPPHTRARGCAAPACTLDAPCPP